MEILLEIPKSVTIPDWFMAAFFAGFLALAVYGIYRIFVPRQPDKWLRGG